MSLSLIDPEAKRRPRSPPCEMTARFWVADPEETIACADGDRIRVGPDLRFI